VENSCNLRIHLDHVVALHSNPLVTSVDLGIDPVLKVLTDDGIDDVCQVGPAELLYLLAGRQGPFYLLVVLSEVEDVLDGQALKLGNYDDLHIVAGDDALHPHCKVSKVPDGHRLIAGEVRTDLGGEEPIHL
jgi:hypothetical protein